MDKKIKLYNRLAVFVLFIGFPLLFWGVDDVPKRSILKETLSVLTLLSFSFMLLEFYLIRSTRFLFKEHTRSNVLKWHKAIGYIFVSILLLHPFFVVLPRYVEAGVDPVDAFVTMVTTVDSLGVLLGLIAWFLLLLIGLTSFFRKQLPFSYKTWRIVHGLLAIVFIVIASWHALTLGRHMHKLLALFVLLIGGMGVFFVLKMYFTTRTKKA